MPPAVSPEVIISMAAEYGYVERRSEASSTLFFKCVQGTDSSSDYPTRWPSSDYPTLINVFYTTAGVMTKVAHPTRGYNEMWRADAYKSVEELKGIFANPRVHTGRGYRKKEKASSGCSGCGLLKRREEFSNNQWRKGKEKEGIRRCKSCIESEAEDAEGERSVPPRAAASNTASSAGDEGSERYPCTFRISEASIPCDAECGWVVGHPAFQCQRCLMAFYCSSECRERHKRTHTVEMPCMDAREMRRDFIETGDGEMSKEMVAGIAMAAQLAGKQDFKSQLMLSAHYQNEERWEHALGIYKNIYDDLPYQDPISQRKVLMGLSRCFYEIGNYEASIGLGEGILEMNRHFPGVHKYIALSQKALGQRDEARKSMMRAILYEAPWDDKNKAENEDFLNGL